jgi:oligopeptide transport system permease protein
MSRASSDNANRATTQSATAADDRARYEALLDEARQMQGVSLGRDAWRRLKRNRAAMAALAFLALLGLSAVFTPLLPLQPPRTVHTARALADPEFKPLLTRTAPWVDDEGQIIAANVKAGFGDLNGFDRSLLRLRAALFGRLEATSWCGCDGLGRDLLARLFWGARVSLVVGIVAALVSLVIGVSYGATSGYLGGRVDSAMMRAVDVLYSIPFIFVVILLITVLDDPKVKKQLAGWGIENRITIFFFVVGAIYWLTMARVVRGQVLSLKQEQFVEAARTIGAGRTRIIFLHLVPNLLSVIIVYLTLTIPRVMLFEAFLSFLGLGVQAPDVSWGVLANEGTQSITPVHIDWWLVVYPGLALGTTLFALNFLGDGLRDALDPRLKNR